MVRGNSSTEPPPLAARFLERALVFSFIIHALAMLSMVALLLPALPGGGTADVAARAAHIARSPFLFRLGWFPWQLTALSDLLISLALLRTKWVPRFPAVVTLVVTLAAIAADQSGQFLWITRGVSLASAAAQGGEDLTRYLEFETSTFRLIGGWATLGYVAGALGWTWCLAAAGVWRPFMTRLSFATWGLFTVAGLLVFVPDDSKPGPWFTALINAVGFVLLQCWLIGATELVLRRSRPDQPHGRDAPWRHPRGGLAGRTVNAISNSRFARALAELLPTPALVSDVRHVIYVNYLVPAETLRPLVPQGLELQTLGGGRWAMFTFLSFHQGHFGPGMFGPLRRLLPSPRQSNWRIYVRDPRTKKEGVYFITMSISHTANAIAGRMLSEGVPMHVPKSFELQHSDTGTTLVIDPGAGSSPDARATLRFANDWPWPAPWGECFATPRAMLEYCVPQDLALCVQPWHRRVVRQEINLGIPLDTIRPMEGNVESAAAHRIVGDAQPVCFYVPSVDFLFEREAYDQI